MKLQINATKMEFFKLRRRLLMAVRGHKLLKNKNEGLMKEFLILVKAYKEARQKVDTDLPNHMKMFLLAQITSSSQNISTALEQSKGTLELKTLAKSILNIKVPVFEVSLTEDNSYSLIDTPTELDDAITQLKEFLPHIIRVAELEQSMRLLAKEIEKDPQEGKCPGTRAYSATTGFHKIYQIKIGRNGTFQYKQAHEDKRDAGLKNTIASTERKL